MIALLGLVTSPVGRYVAIALAAVAIIGGAYLWTYHAGASNAHASDAAASATAAIDSARKAGDAGVRYDADGPTARLRDGRF